MIAVPVFALRTFFEMRGIHNCGSNLVGAEEKNSNSSELPYQIDVHKVEEQPIYQNIAPTALHSEQLGLRHNTIVHRLSVSHKFVSTKQSRGL